MKNLKDRKNSLLLFVIVLTIMSFAASVFASDGYGEPKSDQKSKYFTWIVGDDIPRWVGADCATNFTQYAMIAGQYIGFHEASLFTYADPTSPFDEYIVSGGFYVQYYKGGTNLGKASLSYSSDPVLVSPSWVWFYKKGTANGLLGQGQGIYYAKTTTAFNVEGSISTHTIDNSVSFSVN